MTACKHVCVCACGLQVFFVIINLLLPFTHTGREIHLSTSFCHTISVPVFVLLRLLHYVEVFLKLWLLFSFLCPVVHFVCVCMYDEICME